jgi:hypothetical protein
MQERLTEQNKLKVFEWAAYRAAYYLSKELDLKPYQPFILVPIPSKELLVGAPTPTGPSTALLATEIVKALANVGLSSRVVDAVRWTEKIQKARMGGTRDARYLFERLRVVRTDHDVVPIIVDDVFTTGGHIRAAEARLKTANMAPAFGICALRWLPVPAGDPFDFIVEEVAPLPTESLVDRLRRMQRRSVVPD